MKSDRWIAIAFSVSSLASLALAGIYVAGGNPQLEGALLGVALLTIAVGLVLAAKNLLPGGADVQERDIVPSTSRQRPAVERALDQGAEFIERRRFVARLLGVALGALGLAALFPIRSLGTKPGRELFHTAWNDGLRLVTEDDEPIRPQDVAVNGVLTVFPEGQVDAADAQTLLIRLPEETVSVGRQGFAYQGFVAFSKVCTHAGCPVGLYQAETRELFCPCHQSVFAVMQAARPTGGPATRPLPQLPLGVDDHGYLIARGDFPEPVGPGFWSRGRA